MIRIYVRNKPLFLVDQLNHQIEEYQRGPGTLFMDKLSKETVRTMLRQLDSDTVNAGIFLHHDLKNLFDELTSQLTLIKAGGGLVYTKEQEILLIFRKGKWDLPKGKLEDGEVLEECAVREVQEETGIENVSIVAPLKTSYHTYFEGEKHILKESHWFLMETKGLTTLVPQTEEDIEKCEWVAINELSPYIENMHASIIDIVQEGVAALHEVKG